MYEPYFKYWLSLRIAILLLTIAMVNNMIITIKKKDSYNLSNSSFIVASIIFLNFYLGVLYDELNFKSDNFILLISIVGIAIYVCQIFIYIKKKLNE